MIEYPYPDPVIARNLKRLLAERNVTQVEVARMLNKDRKCVYSWVNCLTSPNTTDFKRLCLIFNISADELLGIDK